MHATGLPNLFRVAQPLYIFGVFLSEDYLSSRFLSTTTTTTIPPRLFFFRDTESSLAKWMAADTLLTKTSSRWQTIPEDILFLIIDILEAHDLVESYEVVRRKWNITNPGNWTYAILRRIKYDLACIYHLCRHWRRSAFASGDGRPQFLSTMFTWTHDGISESILSELNGLILREIKIADTDFDVRIDIEDPGGLDHFAHRIFPILSQRLRRLQVRCYLKGIIYTFPKTPWEAEGFPRLRALSLSGMEKQPMIGTSIPNLTHLDIRDCEAINWVRYQRDKVSV
jgi:hypothetical protein